MYIGKLPCTVDPKEDELLSSWLVRLSHRHLLKVQTFSKLVFPGASIWNRDIDKLGPEGILDILVTKTLSDKEKVYQTTLKAYEGNLYLSHNSYGNTKWLLPLGIYHRTRKDFGLQFCPHCLKKDGDTPYFRKKWRLSFSVVCPECKVYLMDRCPGCGQPVVFFRLELGKRQSAPGRSLSFCFSCEMNLADVLGIPAPRRLVASQRKLYRMLKDGWKKNVLYPHLYFDVLYQLLNLLTGDSVRSEKIRKDLAQRFIKDGPVNYTQKGFDFLSLKNRVSVLKQGLWLLENNQENLIYLGKYHNLTSTVFFGDMRDVPFWYYELVRDNFFVSNVNRQFVNKFIRSEESNWTVAPVNGVRGPKRKYSLEYHCAKCSSVWIVKDGNKNGKPMLKCRNCGSRFHLPVIGLKPDVAL